MHNLLYINFPVCPWHARMTEWYALRNCNMAWELNKTDRGRVGVKKSVTDMYHLRGFFKFVSLILSDRIPRRYLLRRMRYGITTISPRRYLAFSFIITHPLSTGPQHQWYFCCDTIFINNRIMHRVACYILTFLYASNVSVWQSDLFVKIFQYCLRVGEKWWLGMVWGGEICIVDVYCLREFSQVAFPGFKSPNTLARGIWYGFTSISL